MVKDRRMGIAVTEIAYKYAISRKTVYRWLNRYEQYGKVVIIILFMANRLLVPQGHFSIIVNRTPTKINAVSI